jgi:predicted Zn-dependent peptidase
LRTDTQPFGKLYEEFIATSFIAHSYHHPVVGWMSDITTLTVEDATDFYNKYYSPQNAVGALVGDINVERAKLLLDRYFGDIPNRGNPKLVKTKEPEQKGVRTTTVYFEAQPQILIGYHKPTVPDYDDYVFDVINSILSEGRTSRLYTSIIKEKKLALSIDTYQGLPGARYDNLFVFYAVPRHPNTNKDVENAIYQEIEKLKTEPVSEKELQKVRNQIDANFIRRLNSNSGLASMLGYFEVIAYDWKYILKQREIFKKVTPSDIMKVAQKYFIDDNKTIGYLETKE